VKTSETLCDRDDLTVVCYAGCGLVLQLCWMFMSLSPAGSGSLSVIPYGRCNNSFSHLLVHSHLLLIAAFRAFCGTLSDLCDAMVAAAADSHSIAAECSAFNRWN